jgi:hypothetical protein
MENKRSRIIAGLIVAPLLLILAILSLFKGFFELLTNTVENALEWKHIAKHR